MSARAQDVTSKLLLDGRPSNTVNLPTRPPLLPACLLACLPAALPAALLACFACALLACLFACYANNFSPTPHSHSFTYDVGYIYRSFFIIIIPLLFILVLIVAFLFPFFCSRACCCFLLRSYNRGNWCS